MPKSEKQRLHRKAKSPAAQAADLRRLRRPRHLLPEPPILAKNGHTEAQP